MSCLLIKESILLNIALSKTLDKEQSYCSEISLKFTS